MTNYYVYVLQSKMDRKFYTGFTTNLQERLKYHQKGYIESTKKRRPLKLIYWEGCLNKDDAIYREKYHQK